MNTCLACGRTVPPRLDKCMFCGGRAESSLDVEAPISCPACAVPMVHFHEEGLLLDQCGQCHGVWYDRGELEQAMVQRGSSTSVDNPPNAADQPATRATAESTGAASAPAEVTDDAVVASASASPRAISITYRDCPRCAAQMHRKNYAGKSGVVVDECANHGAFLDAREVERIARYRARIDALPASPAKEPPEPAQVKFPRAGEDGLPSWDARRLRFFVLEDMEKDNFIELIELTD